MDRGLEAIFARHGLAFTASMKVAYNVERVRTYMETHLGVQPKEVAYALDLPEMEARRAVRKIRNEWKQWGR